ncbi:nucleoside/nucleotide kinase family protein [Pseudodesulfovibrio piezophilus]|uniref:Shikimate kinase n=1 Tax=Pseudodesulfovibrio piezophilus (strain DSM 21447 / JCM 15486 / C1TLV30) TaxID=1322246 RepID=M1WL22_PSEP2|nr:hypothetical protein [Pseudodesulfovibrio piezophilus]CCH50591.1 conserved protein of unknown function [Pseudodesulfovibrio piezophilus C1TLV30]
MTKFLINEQYDVEEPDVSKAFGQGEKRADYADAWKDTGNIVLIGLAGSGKRALSLLLNQEIGLPVVVPENSAEAKRSLDGTRQIVVLDDALVEDLAIQPYIHGAGKVFYLMTDSNTVSERLAIGRSGCDKQELWEKSSARLALMEPVFYSVLHFILPAGNSPEEILGDALEKIAY